MSGEPTSCSRSVPSTDHRAWNINSCSPLTNVQNETLPHAVNLCTRSHPFSSTQGHLVQQQSDHQFSPLYIDCSHQHTSDCNFSLKISMKTKIYLDYDILSSYGPISLLPFLAKLLKSYIFLLSQIHLPLSRIFSKSSFHHRCQKSLMTSMLPQFTVLVLLGKFVVIDQASFCENSLHLTSRIPHPWFFFLVSSLC